MEEKVRLEEEKVKLEEEPHQQVGDKDWETLLRVVEGQASTSEENNSTSIFHSKLKGSSSIISASSLITL